MKKLVVCLLTAFGFLQFTYGQNFTEEGIASYYADKFEGRKTASGEKYKHSKLTAAHKTLPFGTVVIVTNEDNGKSVEVKVNDRGPFVEGRIIDLSKSAAERIDMISSGLAKVTVKIKDAGDGKGNSYNTSGAPYSETPEDEKEFYSFQVERELPAGYGVQIGSYKELANLVRIADNLRNSYKKHVTVQVSVVNREKFYKIIIGKEKTRSKAEQLRSKLQKRYPDCFIVQFSKI